MKVVADTNILVRVITEDDPQQASLARNALSQAEEIAITIPTLCELVWTLTRRYNHGSPAVAAIISDLVAADNVVTHRASVDAGLAFLKQGGDFADGIIAFEGTALGSDTFLTFDDKAAKLVAARGGAVQLLRSA